MGYRVMNKYYVEYYSNDAGKWEECSQEFTDYGEAISALRLHASHDRDMPHRLVEKSTTTVALTSHGEELIK